MTPSGEVTGPTRGSILLPVIVVLLLIASAATAMTLQARTSLREAAIRRDRLKLGFMADGIVRAAVQALSAANASRKPLPFRPDGSAQACAVPGGGRAIVTVQDEGGLVDLNKGRRELILLVLKRAGVSGWDAKAMSDVILDRRDARETPSRSRPAGNQPATPFANADEIDRLPHMTPDLFDRLRPVFTVATGAATIDPAIAGPALKAIFDPKELTGPTMATMVASSSHDSYTLTATVVSPQGMRVSRRAAIRIDPSDAAVRFVGWDAPVGFDPLPAASADNKFCQAAIAVLSAA